MFRAGRYILEVCKEVYLPDTLPAEAPRVVQEPGPGQYPGGGGAGADCQGAVRPGQRVR